MGKIFWVEFQRVPLKFHTKYFPYKLKDTIWHKVKIFEALNVSETPQLISIFAWNVELLRPHEHQPPTLHLTASLPIMPTKVLSVRMTSHYGYHQNMILPLRGYGTPRWHRELWSLGPTSLDEIVSFLSWPSPMKLCLFCPDTSVILSKTSYWTKHWSFCSINGWIRFSDET